MLGVAVSQMLLFISVNADTIIVTVIIIVTFLGVDGPLCTSQRFSFSRTKAQHILPIMSPTDYR